MSKNIVLIVIAVAVGCGILAVVAYYVVRMMRGSIKLSLLRTAFNLGDTITGAFDLLVKKPIEGNKLTVSLIGTQITEIYRDGKTETRSHEIYRNERVIEGAKAYDAGNTARHEFELTVPNTGAPEFMNSPLGQMLGAAATLFNNRSSQLKWKVEARLDAKGVDLATSTPVSVNIGNLV
jgi:hypothetical protein